jgi:hypothetical protein
MWLLNGVCRKWSWPSEYLRQLEEFIDDEQVKSDDETVAAVRRG